MPSRAAGGLPGTYAGMVATVARGRGVGVLTIATLGRD